MNGMNFETFISKLLKSLSDEQIGALNDLINTHSNAFTQRSLIDPNNLLSAGDKNKIGLYTIQLDAQTIRSGYLIYNNSYCVLLAYVSNSERISEYKIDMTTKKYELIKEYLTTDYLRHEVAIRAIKYEGNDDANIYEVTDIKTISKAVLDELKCGDIVVKITGNQKHAYTVSYKGEGAGQGICLTYADASTVETVSYDRSGTNWVYNSTDVTPLGSAAIEGSLLNGELRNVLQNKSLSVSDFPFSDTDIDTQHAVVNASLLPNGDMSDLSESDINKIILTLNRIINKGWLKTESISALRIASVMYDPTVISIAANSVVFSTSNTMISGRSYLITLDIANASYNYIAGSYNS